MILNCNRQKQRKAEICDFYDTNIKLFPCCLFVHLTSIRFTQHFVVWLLLLHFIQGWNYNLCWKLKHHNRRYRIKVLQRANKFLYLFLLFEKVFTNIHRHQREGTKTRCSWISYSANKTWTKALGKWDSCWCCC